MVDPQDIIAALELQPHPEGGWYRQTWREGASDGVGRGLATAIYFLLEAGKRSHWHRVDGTELWLFHAGSAVDLLIAPGDDGPVEAIRVGPDVLGGDRPQAIVPHGWWQATEAREGWALVSCVVAPGFVFEGFELAPPGWAPKG
jgi:predicted cupin superfamily sugar epimerase